MFMLASLFSWWYTTGWAALAARVGGRVDRTLETFSVGLLARTFFAPFRQISAGTANAGSLEARARAFGDLLFSRVFGAVVRTVFIVIGLLGALVISLIGLVQLVLWPLLPLLPLVGFVVMLTGWTF